MDNYVLPKTKSKYQLLGNDNELMLQNGFDKLKDQLDQLESVYFTKSSYVFGNEETVLDLYLSIILMELGQVEYDLTKWPKTKNWYEQMKQKVECYI